ncbi:MAG TPA: hypothetical protein VH417_15650 [Vicinamibacterales bacterium]
MLSPKPLVMASTDPSNEEQQRVQRELGANERLLWTGKPFAGLTFRTADVMLVPFSLMWGGFALFWEYSVWRSGAPLFFRLWGVPFVAVGLYLIAGRFVVDSRQRAATIYAVTNERVLILSGLFQSSLVSLNLKTVGELSLSEHADGSGSISFGQSPLFNLMRGFSAWPGMSTLTGFDMVPDVRQVFDVLRRAQAAAK